MLKNAADEQQVKEATRLGRRTREKELDDVRAVLDTGAGLRFVWRILNEAGVFMTSFTGEAPSTFFNEGRREMGLRVLADLIDAKPDAYLQMIQMTKKEGLNND
jgi:hypothetical protein